MHKWCNLYDCWCTDVPEVDENYKCELDCTICEYCEYIDWEKINNDNKKREV